MIGVPSRGVAADSTGRREGGIAVGIDTLILQDARVLHTAAGSRAVVEVGNLGHTPLAVEEVEHVLHIETELQAVLGLAEIQFEVVLVTEVDAVYPRRVVTVSLGILALTV